MFIDGVLIADGIDGMFIVIPGGHRMLYCSIVYSIHCPSLVFVDCVLQCPGLILLRRLSILVTRVILSLMFSSV